MSLLLRATVTGPVYGGSVMQAAPLHWIVLVGSTWSMLICSVPVATRPALSLTRQRTVVVALIAIGPP